MKLIPSIPELGLAEVETKVKRFIKGCVKKSGEGVVLGLSGGVDSCTTAAVLSL